MNFYKGFLLALLFFSVNFYITLVKKPIMVDESIVATLDTHPKHLKNIYQNKQIQTTKNIYNGLVKSSIEPKLSYYYNNKQIPILYQDRHSGLGFLFFKPFYIFFDPINATLIFNFICSSLGIFLLGYLINIYDTKWSVLTMVIAAFEPTYILGFSHNISEHLNKLFLLSGIILFLKNNFKLSSFLFALGFINKMSLLLIYPFVLLFFFDKNNYKNILKTILYFIIFSSPYLLLLDWQEIVNNRENIILGDLDLQIIHYPFKDLFNFIFNKTNFHGIFFDPNFILSNLKWGNLSYWIPSISGFILLFTLLPFLYYNSNKKILIGIFSITLYTLTLQIVIPNMAIKLYYFHDWSPFLVIFLSYLLIKSKRFYITFLLIIIFPFIQWQNSYKLVSHMDANFYQQVYNKVKDYKRIYLIGEGELGVIDFLSKNKIKAIHLPYYNFKSYKDLINKLPEGILVIHDNDLISDHYWKHRNENLYELSNNIISNGRGDIYLINIYNTPKTQEND